MDKIKRKLEAILNCMKDSEKIFKGEYYIIHSDFIIALEEEIQKLNINIEINGLPDIRGKDILKQIKRGDD